MAHTYRDVKLLLFRLSTVCLVPVTRRRRGIEIGMVEFETICRGTGGLSRPGQWRTNLERSGVSRDARSSSCERLGPRALKVLEARAKYNLISCKKRPDNQEMYFIYGTVQKCLIFCCYFCIFFNTFCFGVLSAIYIDRQRNKFLGRLATVQISISRCPRRHSVSMSRCPRCNIVLTSRHTRCHDVTTS